VNAKEHLSAIVRVDTAHPARQGKVRLDRNERPHPWPPDVWAEMHALITPELIQSYPALEPLYAALSEHFGLPRDHLLLSHASDAALKSIFEVYARPGDEAVILDPSYAMYPLYARMFGATPRPVPFAADLSLDFGRVLEAVGPATRLVCLPCPNQPVERMFSRAEIQEMLALAKQRDFLVVVDEAYAYFQPETAVDLIPGSEQLIVTRTFSKAFGLAGVRGGLLLARPERIAELRTIKPISEMNAVAAALARYLLGRMDVVRAFADEVAQGREAIRTRAAALGLDVHGRYGNSVLLGAPDPQTAKNMAKAAEAEGILVKCFADPLLQSHLRITLGPPAYMHRVMDALERSLA
jgi:histidinol-phosphate aminotransferase